MLGFSLGWAVSASREAGLILVRFPWEPACFVCLFLKKQNKTKLPPKTECILSHIISPLGLNPVSTTAPEAKLGEQTREEKDFLKDSNNNPSNRARTSTI